MAVTTTARTATRIQREIERLEYVVMRSLTETDMAYLALLGAFTAMLLFGVVGYLHQLKEGLGVTGLNDKVSWGFYIHHFVFLIGMSYGGALISAILRLTGAEWRRPITRLAETVSVATLLMGAIMPIIDLGRPDRMLNLFTHGRLQSPIVWDMMAVNTYVVATLIFLYLPMIPDMATCRDRLAHASGLGLRLRHRLYSVLALRWRGTEAQKRHLNRGIAIMAIMIIPVAISVHTVLSWILSMTLRTGWNSTIYGPYFVVAAVLSGIATILVFMAIFRKLYHLEDYITEKQFRYLAYLMLAFVGLYAYFTLSEYLTVGYKMEPFDKMLLQELMLGRYAGLFWFFAVGGLIVPAFLIVLPATRNIPGIVTAAVLVNIALWLKRYLIVVPSMALPQMPYEWALYNPTWVEWSIVLGTLGGSGLIFALFAKLFPIISVWEMEEGLENAPDQFLRVPARRGLRQVPRRERPVSGAPVLPAVDPADGGSGSG